MSSQTIIREGAAGLETEHAVKPRTVAIASLVGTTIEWYDFFIFGSLAGIVFNRLFFPAGDALVATMLAYATFAVGFLVRPIGGVLFGHFGDRMGRRPLLILTLVMMGVATFLIGLLPTYAQIGIAAPIALVVLRVVQGLALSGEWGGAVLMAYEHAEEKDRTFYASFPQVGLAAGLCLSTATIAVLSTMMSNEAFLEWGWRVPFLLSVLLLAVGFFIRIRVLETPAFRAVRERREVTATPALEVVRNYFGTLVLGWLSHLIMGIVFAVYCVYMIPVLVAAGFSRASVLFWIAAAGLLLVFTIPFAAHLANRYGVRRVYGLAALVNGLAAFPVLWVMQYSGSPTLAFAAMVFAFGVIWAPLFGPQPTLYCELFETRLRYSGISLIFQIGAVLSISMTPLIAAWLGAQAGGAPWLVAAYMLAAGVVSAISVGFFGRRYP